MKVAFVCPEMEVLGIQYLSSVLKQKKHQTKLFFDPQLFEDTVTVSKGLGRVFDFKERLIQEIIEYAPDVIAFSVLSTNYDWAISFSKEIKNKVKIPIVFGGIHPTAVPEEVIKNESVDYVIVGEGEHVFPELLDSRFDEKLFPAVQNLCFKSNGMPVVNPLRALVADLDRLPFPDKDLFYSKMPYLQKSYTIITARGCPYSCTYCCNGFLNKLYKGKYLRRRSPENVIAELQDAKKKYKIKNIYFDDSTFTYDKKWLRSFATEYKEKINLPFFCWVYPANVDQELLEILKFMGCRAVEMGVESLSREVREKVFHRFYSNSDIETAIRLFSENKIFSIVDNIKGFSDSLEKETVELIEFYNRNRPNKIYVFEHRSFPKTEIIGRLSHGTSLDEELLPFTITTAITTPKVKQLELLLVLIYFLPRAAIDFLLKSGWYAYFPSIRSYNLLEIFPYFINMLKLKKHRVWYPIRGTRRRYFHYFFAYPGFFFKRLHLLWA